MIERFLSLRTMSTLTADQILTVNSSNASIAPREPGEFRADYDGGTGRIELNYEPAAAAP